MKRTFLIFILSFAYATEASNGPDSLTYSEIPAKNEVHAYALAVAGTAFSVVPIVGWIIGPTLGPSLGQIYAGAWWQAAIASTVRAGGMAIIVASVLNGFQCDNCSTSTIPIQTGLALWAGGTIYSLIDTHYAVKRANERARIKRTATSFNFTPILTRNADGNHRAGIMARLNF